MDTQEIARHIAAGTPKNNIRVCGHEDRTVLFCNECRGQGYEYLEMKHRTDCATGKALAVHKIENVA